MEGGDGGGGGGGEAARRARNEQAWAKWSGYETSSGCACWDASPNFFIPKSANGVGFNPNCYAFLCCCLCDKKADAAAAQAATGAAK